MAGCVQSLEFTSVACRWLFDLVGNWIIIREDGGYGPTDTISKLGTMCKFQISVNSGNTLTAFIVEFGPLEWNEIGSYEIIEVRVN